VRRRDLLGGGLVATLLAACSQTETGAPTSDPPHPDVLRGQAQHVLAEVDAAIARAYAARSPRLLGTRVVGPAARALTARLTVAASEKRTVPAPSVMTLERLGLPAAGNWPRWFLAAGTVSGRPTPVLRVLRSVTPRDPYGLWGELLLLPGASLPDLASPTTGTPLVDPADGRGLAGSASSVLSAYAGALMTGSTGGGFAPDQFREQVAGQAVADRRALGNGRTAEVTSVHRPSDDGALALRTQDGGALVIGALEQLYRVTVPAGSGGTVSLDPDLAALAGVPRIGRRLQRTSVELLAFRVPPAGRGAVSLVAADKEDVSATGS
jgi:hypothetical protein